MREDVEGVRGRVRARGVPTARGDGDGDADADAAEARGRRFIEASARGRREDDDGRAREFIVRRCGRARSSARCLGGEKDKDKERRGDGDGDGDGDGAPFERRIDERG